MKTSAIRSIWSEGEGEPAPATGRSHRAMIFIKNLKFA
jgi:hypothetical protein